MYQGTTPTMRFRIPGINITETSIYLTLTDRYGLNISTFRNDRFTVERDGRDTVIKLKLEQSETLRFTEGDLLCQVRWIWPDGTAGATKKTRAKVNTVLQKGVIYYA